MTRNRGVMEVECRLEGGVAAYLAGEEVRATVVFSLPPTADWEVGLAWATVQLHCFCTVNHTKVAIPGAGPDTRGGAEGLITRKNSATSYQPTAGEAGVCVLSTPAKILACDLTLHPGEAATFHYSETIPATAPPTYRGAAVKYSYKLTVGAQRLDSKTVSLLRVPIRVLSVSGITVTPNTQDEDQERLGPSSPFLDPEAASSDTEGDGACVASTADLIMQSVQDVTSKRRAQYFNIANSRGRVAKFCLFKTDYRLGEDIVASLDFTAGTVQCVQYSVSLCMKEQVHGDYKVRVDQQDRVLCHSKHHEVSIGFSHSHLVLPVPLQLAPSFSTPVCCVSYYLHFQFVTTPTPATKQDVPSEEGGSEWQGPGQLDVETMVWDLPVRLYTTFPNHAAQGHKLDTKVQGKV